MADPSGSPIVPRDNQGKSQASIRMRIARVLDGIYPEAMAIERHAILDGPLRNPSSDGAGPSGGSRRIDDWTKKISSMSARALLAATNEKLLVDPRKRKPKGPNTIMSDQIAKLDRELASLQVQVISIEDSYGIDNLHLTLANG